MRLITLILVLVSTITVAQDLQWKKAKGPGGTTGAIVFDSLGNMYTGTLSRIMRSSDEGLSWTDITPSGLGTMASMSVSPEGVLFAGEGTSGATTQKKWNLYRTTNQGATWDIIKTNYHTTQVNAIGRDTVYLLGRSGNTYSILISANNGTTWSSLPANTILPKFRAYLSIAYDGTLFIDYDDYNDRYFYRSTDRGQTWTKLINQAAGGHRLISNRTGTLYTASTNLRKSEDNGRTWTDVDHPFGVEGFTCMANGDLYTTCMIYGETFNIHRSTDGGNTWKKMLDTAMYGTGLTTNYSGDKLFLLYPGPTLVENNGATLRYRPAPCGYVSALMIDPDGSLRYPGGVSSNGGDTWSRIRTTTAPYYPGAIVRLGMDSAGGLLGRAGDEFVRATDGGTKWKIVKPGLATKAFVTTPNGAIFVVHEIEGVFRTTDLGQTWDMFSSFGSRKLRSVTCNYAGTVFLGADGTIFKSTNNGESWINTIDLLDRKANFIGVPMSYASMNCLVHTRKGEIVAAFDGQEIVDSTVTNGVVRYQTTARNGILISTDDGHSWKEMTAGLLNDNVSEITSGPKGEIYGLSFRPNVGNQVIYLGDQASSWVDINAGLQEMHDLKCIVVGNDGSAYIGTGERSVYKRGGPSSDVGNKSPGQRLSLMLRPNPAQNMTTISYYLTDTDNVQADLCDGLGRVHRTFIHETQPAGFHTFSAYIHGLSTGIYFVRLTTTKTTETTNLYITNE